MTKAMDGVELTRKLVGFRTVNPPGDEAPCAAFLAEMLTAAGFACDLLPIGENRTNLIARIGGGKAPLVFTGHIDTVPLGAREWSVDPFAGEIKDGRLFGRGSSDMKSGVATFVAAAIANAEALRNAASGVVLAITAGEETGCDGALAMSQAGALTPAGALVVGEPTGNAAMIGHKGALWLAATTHGVTAHGSMPDKGDNAVYKVARAITRLADFDFNVARHPVLGKPTLNVGTVHGGLNINSVPDRAEIRIDVRTIPGMDHANLREGLTGVIGENADIDTLFDLGGVWTEPDQPWLARAAAIASAVTGEPFSPQAAPYFTDASVLTPALGAPPTLILGPGETAMAHQTDEYALVSRIEEAVKIYGGILADWLEKQG